MGRVIHTANPTRIRNAALKKMVLSIREFVKSSGQDSKTMEVGAALMESLREISESVNHTAEAWEKRDYWLKADAFRRQWAWVEKSMAGMKKAASADDPAELRIQIVELGAKLQGLKIS